LGWALAAGSLVADQAQAALVFPTTLFGNLWGVGVLVGISGIGALALFLARFAYWVRDEFAAKAFATAVWGGVFSAPLVLLLPAIRVTIGPFVIFLVPVILVVIVLLLLVTVAAFPVGLYSLSRSVDWSVVHAKDRTDRDRRLHERLAPRPPPRVVPTGDIDLADSPPETPGEPPKAGP
jgi:fatty acid desaturase